MRELHRRWQADWDELPSVWQYATLFVGILGPVLLPIPFVNTDEMTVLNMALFLLVALAWVALCFAVAVRIRKSISRT